MGAIEGWAQPAVLPVQLIPGRTAQTCESGSHQRPNTSTDSFNPLCCQLLRASPGSSYSSPAHTQIPPILVQMSTSARTCTPTLRNTCPSAFHTQPGAHLTLPSTTCSDLTCPDNFIPAHIRRTRTLLARVLGHLHSPPAQVHSTCAPASLTFFFPQDRKPGRLSIPMSAAAAAVLCPPAAARPFMGAEPPAPRCPAEPRPLRCPTARAGPSRPGAAPTAVPTSSGAALPGYLPTSPPQHRPRPTNPAASLPGLAALLAALLAPTSFSSSMSSHSFPSPSSSSLPTRSPRPPPPGCPLPIKH